MLSINKPVILNSKFHNITAFASYFFYALFFFTKDIRPCSQSVILQMFRKSRENVFVLTPHTCTRQHGPLCYFSSSAGCCFLSTVNQRPGSVLTACGDTKWYKTIQSACGSCSTLHTRLQKRGGEVYFGLHTHTLNLLSNTFHTKAPLTPDL